MNTHPLAVSLKTCRRATKSEIEQAAMALRSVSEVFADLILAEHAFAYGKDIAVVVTDFSNVPETAQVLLVPSGTHDVPIELLDRVQYIVGLGQDRADYPRLNLQGELGVLVNSDTLEESPVCVASSCARFVGVMLDAPQPTVLEVYLGNDQFSAAFFNVLWSSRVDAYNQASCTAYNGWTWVIEAYGSSLCRRRNILEKGMDAMFTGVMNTIDGIFQPLVRLVERGDKLR